MSTFEKVIEDFTLDVGLLEHYHSGVIERVDNLLALIKDIAPNLVGLSQEDFESMVIKALTN